MAQSDQDLPWTEAQWDEFMRHADLRAARYTELLETLIDDPNRDEIIGREMGWDRRRDAGDQQWLSELEEAAQQASEPDENHQSSEQPAEAAGSTSSDFLEQRDRELERIPAYDLAEQASRAIDRVLVPLMDGECEGDEDVAQGYVQIKIAAAKIAAGHGMGYEDEVIGGNVVNCKRALAATQECELALKAVASKQLVPAEDLPQLLELVAKTRGAINARITELRAQMWWQHESR